MLKVSQRWTQQSKISYRQLQLTQVYWFCNGRVQTALGTKWMYVCWTENIFKVNYWFSTNKASSASVSCNLLAGLDYTNIADYSKQVKQKTRSLGWLGFYIVKWWTGLKMKSFLICYASKPWARNASTPLQSSMSKLNQCRPKMNEIRLKTHWQRENAKDAVKMYTARTAVSGTIIIIGGFQEPWN